MDLKQKKRVLGARKKRTIHKKKSKKKKRKQRNRYKKRRTYKKNTAGNVVVDLNSINEERRENPEEDLSFHIEKWEIDMISGAPVRVQSENVILLDVNDDRARFTILSPDDGLTTNVITINKDQFGINQTLDDEIWNEFPLTLVKKLSNEASGRKKKKKSKKHKRKNRKKTRRGGKRRK